MTYADLLTMINAEPREAGACTPPVCEAWKATDDDGQLLVNAILGWEVGSGRRAGQRDEAEILASRDELRANRDAARAARAGDQKVAPQ